jgi:type IV pilus assembly protein PilO
MKMEDLSNLSAENIGSWPLPVKAAVIGVVFVVVCVAGYYLDTADQIAALDTVIAQEATLKKDFEEKQAKAARLPDLEKQLVIIQETFGDLLRRLPNKTEIAALLVDISQQGLGSGLEFELFRPGAEAKTEFYVELPINIKVTGTYHQFGRFVSGVSDLPRIVTMHDIKITRIGSGSGAKLSMDAVAKTYRYMDEEEETRKK